MSIIPKTVLFFNPFEDFTCSWGKEPYTVKQNKQIYMQDWLAYHIRKHLVDRELNNANLPTDFLASPSHKNYAFSRDVLEARCILKEGGEVEHVNSVSQELDLLNKGKEPSNPTHSNQYATSDLPEVPVVTESASKPWCESCDSKGVRHKKVCPLNTINWDKKAPTDTLPPINPS